MNKHLINKMMERSKVNKAMVSMCSNKQKEKESDIESLVNK